MDGQAGEYSFGGQADTLPVAPGLYVDGVGPIPVPLVSGIAEKLIARSEKSPYGHNMDTKMDDNVRKSWQIEPDKVEIKNPEWLDGIQDMVGRISERLGYKDMPLQCILYKLLVYREGGHFLKHQDTEKEQGMIATLVIQPPSLHEGGDLVVYRGGDMRYRHDFGKAENTAAYLPHYAVHYADAGHALEKVASGYRLALVYSICLPLAEVHLERCTNKPLSEDLASAISAMGVEDEAFALLLSHEYTEESALDYGTRSLKGIDRVRVGSLEEANSIVPADKKLVFFLAKLNHKVTYEKSERKLGWIEADCKEGVSWYAVNGNCLGDVKKTEVVFNFLNPDQHSLSELWLPHGTKKEEGYTGNEGPSSSTKYSRFALVAWPATRHVDNALKYLCMDITIEALAARKPLNADLKYMPMDIAAAARKPIDAAAFQVIFCQVKRRLKMEKKNSIYLRDWCCSSEYVRVFCDLLVAAGNPALVQMFFTELFPHLGGVEENETLVPSIVAVIRAYDRSEIGPALLKALGTNAPSRLGNTPM